MAHASQKSENSTSHRVTGSAGQNQTHPADTVPVASMMHHMAVLCADPTTLAVTFVGLNHSHALTAGLQRVVEHRLNVEDVFVADVAAMSTSTLVVSGKASEMQQFEQEMNSATLRSGEPPWQLVGESRVYRRPPAFRTQGDAVLTPLEVGLSVTMPHRWGALATVMACLDERKFQVRRLFVDGDHPLYENHKRVRMWFAVPRDSHGPVTDGVLCDLRAALAEKVRSMASEVGVSMEHWELHHLEEHDQSGSSRAPQASVN